MPELITEAREIYRHVREPPYAGATPRPVCGGCKKSTMVVKVDHGPSPGGCPSYGWDEKLYGPRPPRVEHIGYWCPRCRVFYPLPETQPPAK